MENMNSKQWVTIFIALIIGLGAGFYLGNWRGVQKEKAAQEAQKKEAEKEAAKAVNPFESTATNPFEKSPTNPFDNVKVNPFK